MACVRFFVVTFIVLCISNLFTVLFPVAFARDAIFLEQHKDWGAYKKGDTCFVISEPRVKRPKNVKRGEIYMFVIHRPKQKIFNEVSILLGYPLKKGSDVTAMIGSDKHIFFTVEENAWLETKLKEKKIVGAMKRGKEMRVKGVSQRGTLTTDVYSLFGFSAALKVIDKACSKK